MGDQQSVRRDVSYGVWFFWRWVNENILTVEGENCKLKIGLGARSTYQTVDLEKVCDIRAIQVNLADVEVPIQFGQDNGGVAA